MVRGLRQRLKYIVSDYIFTSLAWAIFNVIRYNDIIEPQETYTSLTDFLCVKQVWLVQILFPMLMLVLYYLSGYYNQVFFRSRVEELTGTFSTALIGTLIIYFAAIVNDPIPDRASNYELLIMLLSLLFILVYLSRLAITQATKRRIEQGQITFKTIIVGPTQQAHALRQKLARKGSGNRHTDVYKIIGYVTPQPTTELEYNGIPVYQLEDVEQVCSRHNVQYVILTQGKGKMSAILNIVNRLFPLDIPILISPTLFQLITSKPKIGDLKSEPLIDITHANMSESTKNLKRAGDFIVSLLSLIVLSPVYCIIAACIRIDSKGPILYRQERIGLRKKPFKIIKFRTMRTDAEAFGPALSSDGDSRITRVGHYLRKYRLDELPQFWNVLKGEMSIVGPRPEREFYIRQIVERAPYYTLVHQVRPGITSLGMVKHGYAQNVEAMVDRLQYDLIYIENISFTIDVKVLIYTVSTVVNGRGI
jgi:exopolysaccharide biosynthesis polyprenyl glycosylphosphotransferase